MSDESDSDTKSSKKKGSKSKGSKSSKSKSTEQKPVKDQTVQDQAVQDQAIGEATEPSPTDLEEQAAPQRPIIYSHPPRSRPTVSEPTVSEPTIQEPEGSDHVTTSPAPVDEEPVVQPAEEPVPAVPVVEKPQTAEPIVAEPVTAGQVDEEPVVQPGDDPWTDKPVVQPADDPWTDKPVGADPKAQPTSASVSKEPIPGASGGGGRDNGGSNVDDVPPGWPEPAPRFVVSNIVTIILGVIAVGLVVGLVLTMLQLSNKNALESARTTALTAAKTYAIELSSYDYKDLHKDFATVESHSTASFKKSFSQSSGALESTLVKYKASSQATILASAVVSANTSRVVALIFLSQTVNNSTQKAATTDRSQIQMTLVNSDGQWLIDTVTLL
jgi:Mce-associated membrane protein